MSTDPNETPPPPVVRRSTATPAPDTTNPVPVPDTAPEARTAPVASDRPADGSGYVAANGRYVPSKSEYVAAGYKAENYADFVAKREAEPPVQEQPIPDAALIQRTGDELAKSAAPAEPTGFPFFCTDSKHPGPGGPADMFNLESRTFYVDDPENGCPVCPYCNRQTASIPLEDVTQLPPSHRALKERLETAERAR